MSNTNIPPRTNVPIVSLISGTVLLAVVVIVLAFANPDRTSTPLFATVIGLVVTTVPSLIAAAYAERVSKDVRNGTLVQKTKQATHEAIREAGLITRDGPAMTLAMEGLAQVLRQTGKSDSTQTAQKIERAMQPTEEGQGA